MSVKLSVISPVLNEVDFIGYSVMAALPFVHEFIYMLDAKSSDGTRELLRHLGKGLAAGKMNVIETPTFHPSDQEKYNEAFNAGVRAMTGDAAWFLHPDMIVTEFPKDGLSDGPLAWFTHLTSYVKDMGTIFSKGRCDRWKNIHANRFGLHYFGEYGDSIEDWYHKDITGAAHHHYGTEFSKYPFAVADSGIRVNHYCELKPYARRFEKMKSCLRSQFPNADEDWIAHAAAHHPRVTLENTSQQFGAFEFAPSELPAPDVFERFRTEFEAFSYDKTKGEIYA